MPSTRMRFAMLLPLLSLVVATVLVAVPFTLTYLNFEVLAQHSNKAVIAGILEIPRSDFLRHAVIFGTIQSVPAIEAVDMPGIIATIPGQPAKARWLEYKRGKRAK